MILVQDRPSLWVYLIVCVWSQVPQPALPLVQSLTWAPYRRSPAGLMLWLSKVVSKVLRLYYSEVIWCPTVVAPNVPNSSSSSGGVTNPLVGLGKPGYPLFHSPWLHPGSILPPACQALTTGPCASHTTPPNLNQSLPPSSFSSSDVSL